MPKSKTKPTPKKKLKPVPPVIRSPVGPQPPPILRVAELEDIKHHIDALAKFYTLRQISAAVDYLVQKQQWENS